MSHYYETSNSLRKTLVHNVNAIYNFFNALSQFKKGLCSGLFLLFSVYFICTILTHENHVQFVFNVINASVAVMSIVSLFTWLRLICGNNLSDNNIYFLFIITVFSEFVGKEILFNTFLANTMNSKSFPIDMSENLNCTILIAFISSFFIYIIDLRKKIPYVSFFVGVITTTRIYGVYYISYIVPTAFSSYVAYICGLAGCVFSQYICTCLNTMTIITRNLEVKHDLAFKAPKLSILNTQTLQTNEKKTNLKSTSRRTKTANSNVTMTASLFKRRTSLPTIPIMFDKCFPDNLLFNEIQNQINDILNNNDDILSEHIFKSLKVIKNLIVQAKLNSETPIFYGPENFINQQPIITTNNTNSNSDFSIPTDRKYSLSTHSQKSFTLNSPFIPTMKHKRSVSLKNPDYFLNNEQKPREDAWSALDTLNQSLSKDPKNTSDNESLQSLEDLSETSNQIKMLNVLNNLIKYNDDFDENIASGCLNSNHSNPSKTSDYDSGESPNSSDYNSDTDKLQLKEQYRSLENGNAKKMNKIKEEINAKKKQSLTWSPDDIEDVHLLQYIHDWNFPIFQLYEKSQNNILSHVAYKIFEQVGLFQSFNIPVDLFINYFTALESGYNDLPYHNKIHAADVLHACYYLTTASVPEFTRVESSTFNPDCKKRLPLNILNQTNAFGLNSKSSGCLGTNFLPLELLALFCSAAMHDYEHPGRNNQFLISNKSPLALLYNDRSVLENHHTASSWLLLKSDPKYNFLSNLEAKEWKQFRNLVVENILATDLSRHFEIIEKFKSRIDPNPTNQTLPSGINWANQADRQIVGQMIIKLSDINAPLKERKLHVQWTERICEEFYQQGEEELSLGLPQSLHMDRKNPKMAKLQESFIKVLVKTLCDPYISAGLLPGILIENPEATDNSESATNDQSKINQPKKIFYSELASNLQTNYEIWSDISRQEEIKLTANS